MKHLKKGYVYNGKSVPGTSMEVNGIDQRMTDAADGNSTRPRLLINKSEEEEDQSSSFSSIPSALSNKSPSENTVKSLTTFLPVDRSADIFL